MMSWDNTSSYAASGDLYQRAVTDAYRFGPLIATHAVEEPNQVNGSCMPEYPAMAVTYSSPLPNLDERRWQQSVFPGKTGLSKEDRGAWEDWLYSRKRYTFLEERAARKTHKTAFHSLKHAQLHDKDKHSPSISQDVRDIYARLSRRLHMDEIPGCVGSNRYSGSGQYGREISASDDTYSLVSRLLHEKSPAYNSSKEESASSQYAKEVCLSNEEIPGRNSLKENSASTQYAREICASNNPSLLHEESPACTSFKEDSASTQYARELCGSNDPSLPLSRLLHEESPFCNSFKEDFASNLYAKEICASNDTLLLSCLLPEEIPGRNRLKEHSAASSQYAKDMCASNDLAVLLSRLSHEEIPGGNSTSKEDSASSQHTKDICPSNDPSLLLSGLLQEESPGCNSSKEYSASSHYKKEIRSGNDPSLLLSRLLNADTPGCSSSEKGSKSELYSQSKKLSVNNCSRTQLGSSSTQCESSVSERCNKKFTKVTKESTMKCGEAISSCVPSQEASGVELRNVDCAPTYLLPGGGEELVLIEHFFVIVDQDSNSRERNVKNCYQGSDQNEDFENEVGKFHEITSRDWSLNTTEIGVEVEETIHDEFCGNRAVIKSKATDELLDDWLIL